MPTKRKRTSEIQVLERKRRTYQHMLESMSEGDLLPSEMHQLSEHLQRRMNAGIDIGYLKTVMFPEQYSYDIPFPLTSVSFCKFTDKQEILVNTGTNGAGTILWYPRTTAGPQVFVYPDSLSTGVGLETFYKVSGAGATVIETPGWLPGPFVKSSQYFNQAALVAGAMTLQYIGKVENESGLMVGGHLYGLAPENVTTDEIENSQWVTRARPGEGLRFVYLPRDQTDFEFYQTAGPIASVGPFTTTNAGANKVNPDSIATVTVNTSILTTANDGGWCLPEKASGIYKKTYVAPFNTAQLKYSKSANCIAIYWTGMEPNQNWLRLDIARKFDGIPQAQYRDILELTRPVKQFDERKTFNVLNNLCQSTPIGGHTLKEVDRIVDRISAHLPNVSYLMEQGGIKQVNTLEQLADVLEHPNQEEKGLNGAAQGEIGRIYHYF